MTKSSIKRIYGKSNLLNVTFDKIDKIEQSVCQSNIISVGLSTASIHALSSQAICFCVSFLDI